jgi:hypothetical protein
VDYISPWSSIGPPPRFGWTFKNDEVEAFIRGLPYVDFVTKFSMLHITRDENGLYRLDDTASPYFEGKGPDGVATGAGVLQISPRYPWSLAIPNRTHILETPGDDRDIEVAPEITGVGKLTVGDTFTMLES